MAELKTPDAEKEVGKVILSRSDERFGTLDNFSRYLVCTNGQIFSNNYNHQNKFRIMKHQVDRYGYAYIKLFDDKKKAKKMKIHRIVALVFLPNKSGREQVNHLDGKKLNNNVKNLEWSNHKENMNHAKINGLINSPKGSKCGAHKLVEGQIPVVNRLLKNGVTQKEIARLFGVTRDAIGKIKRGETWSHLDD